MCVCVRGEMCVCVRCAFVSKCVCVWTGPPPAPPGVRNNGGGCVLPSSFQDALAKAKAKAAALAASRSSGGAGSVPWMMCT